VSDEKSMKKKKAVKETAEKNNQKTSSDKIQYTPSEKKADLSKIETRGIGITGVNPPETKCDDKNCPFHGGLKVRGRTFVGIVKSAKAKKTSTVEWTRWKIIKKYERYEKRKTKICVHNPPCINAAEGDEVMIAECRPLSKTKNFVVVSITRKKA